MPKQGLSLFGFMEESDALSYLAMRCILPDKSVQALRQHWTNARTKLGQPVANAGYPDIQDIPKNYKSYLQGVVNKNPRYQSTVNNLPCSFKLIEIDALLCYQFHVELGRIVNPFGTTGPTMSRQLELCLPQNVDDVPPGYEFRQDSSILIKTSNLNIDVLGKGPIASDIIQKVNVLGVLYGLTSPLVQVVRYQGRCYLKNGFHRAYELRRAGITHIPCLFLEGSDYQRDVGPMDKQAAFLPPLLESDNPPMFRHFSQDCAYPLMLRGISRIVHVSWSMFNVLDEE